MIRYYLEKYTSEEIKRYYEKTRELGYNLRVIYEEYKEDNSSFYTIRLGNYMVDIISSERKNRFELLERSLELLFNTLRLIESQKHLPKGFLKRNPELKIKIK